MYAKVAWEQVVKFVRISTYFAEALLKGFDQTLGDRNILCRGDKLKTTWNWKLQYI